MTATLVIAHSSRLRPFSSSTSHSSPWRNDVYQCATIAVESMASVASHHERHTTITRATASTGFVPPGSTPMRHAPLAPRLVTREQQDESAEGALDLPAARVAKRDHLADPVDPAEGEPPARSDFRHTSTTPSVPSATDTKSSRAKIQPSQRNGISRASQASATRRPNPHASAAAVPRSATSCVNTRIRPVVLREPQLATSFTEAHDTGGNSTAWFRYGQPPARAIWSGSCPPSGGRATSSQ
jgi:hypothetical protein